MIKNIWFRIFYDFRFYYNIYTDLERQNILEKSKQYLQDWSHVSDYPGLQTPPNIHREVDLSKLFSVCGTNKKIERCWLNYTRKGFPDYYCWHTHPHRYTCVYYFNDGPGTVFKGIRKDFQINVPKNTLIVFPAHIFHSAPVHEESERYTIAFDFDL